MRHQRKPAKVRVGKASVPVPDIPLQEPILITDVGAFELTDVCSKKRKAGALRLVLLTRARTFLTEILWRK